VLILGKGDFFSRLHYCTSFVVFADDFKLLVECPDPLHKMLHEASRKSGIALTVDDLDNVLVTHLHGDHCNGLEGYGFYKHFIQRRKPTIYTSRAALRDLWNHKLKASMGYTVNDAFGARRKMRLEDYFTVRPLEFGRRQRIGKIGIEIHRTRHYLPCFGFRMSFHGRSLGYSSDTDFDPGLIRFLSKCDMILHETNHGGHTPHAKLLELPGDIKGKMVLVHLPDDFDARRSRIRVAEEGRLYTV
jgi:ribonuclease BN (tRNA processing enzyme)